MKKLLIPVALSLLAVPLSYAQMTDFDKLVSAGTSQSVLAAIKQGADVNAKESQGMTPLLSAAGNNPNPDTITVLLNAGADLAARMGNGETVLIAARLATRIPK